MELFQKLGTEIEDLWRDLNYNEDLLPELAASALKRADLPSKLSAWDAVEWGLTESELPRQRDVYGRFGDPPITVFSAPRFHIDIYFWFDGTTAMHQHSFCGAFQVLLGSSIHSWYEFESRHAINAFTEIGDYSLKLCEILEVGDVQEIWAGRRYIHSLFHLDQPSATIVVRTDKSPLCLPQFSYHKPSLAVDPFFEQETTTKKMQLVQALLHARHPDADRLITGWLETCDFQTTFNLLSSVRAYLRSNQLEQLFNLSEPGSRFQRFLDVARSRHGAHAEALVAAFVRHEMLDEIVRRRSYVTNAEHRFFMALLLNIDGRDQIFGLVKQKFPDTDPLEKVLDWTYDLANTRVISDNNTNALGLPGFDEIDLFVFEKVLKGLSGAEIVEAFKVENGDARDDLVETLQTREQTIREAVIFQPLLVSSRVYLSLPPASCSAVSALSHPKRSER